MHSAGRYVLDRIRVLYEKGEEVRYISHLDILRVFDRAVRRAELPLAFSKGFNPHPLMTFALPLPVGTTSETEYADFEMETEIPADIFMSSLNQNLPEGIRVQKAEYVHEGKSLMASVRAALYRIEIEYPENAHFHDLAEGVKNLLDQENIFVQKKGEAQAKAADIKPQIHGCEIEAAGDRILVMKILLDAGSRSNLRPELVVEELEGFLGMEFEDYRIHRIGLYKEDRGDLFRV